MSESFRRSGHAADEVGEPRRRTETRTEIRTEPSTRMTGVKQGIAVWVIGLLVTIALGVVVAVAGSTFDVLSQLNLPSLPFSGSTMTTAGIIALVAAPIVTLIGAILGGSLGTRYHRKVDRAGFTAV